MKNDTDAFSIASYAAAAIEKVSKIKVVIKRGFWIFQ
jgi:hypothetical protein